MTTKQVFLRVAIPLGVFSFCWVLLLALADSPVVDQAALHQSLEAGLARDCLKLVEENGESLTFLKPDVWPASVASLRPDKVIVTKDGVSISVWVSGDDKFQQSTSVYVLRAGKPPCLPGNPSGLEYCEKVADGVYIHYTPARLRDGKATLFSKVRAHFQKAAFKY